METENAGSQAEFITKLANALEKFVRPPIPLSVDLWDIETIALYLKRDPQVIRERIVCKPDFPDAIRLPSAKGRAHPLYRASEVIAWVEAHREAPGRPRKHS